MNIVLALVLAAIFGINHGSAAADVTIERLATCQDSWLELKNDPARMAKLAESLRTAFVHKEGNAFLVPRTPTLILGLPVLQVFPESVGMGVGFSVLMDADFDKSRRSVEKAIGKSLNGCDTSDNMRTCQRDIAAKKTVILMADADGKSKTTLLGCYYYYEK